MNDLKFAFRQLLKNSSFTPVAVLMVSLGLEAFSSASAFAELAVRRVQVAASEPESRVPEVSAQGRFLAPQAISVVDISADGNIITVGTMAFGHDANVWQFSPDGAVMAKRHFPHWAPMQVATLSGGRAMAVGLAYSRVTSPDPTVWFGPSAELLAATLTEELAEADATDGQFARLRPGSGDWRSGWMASSLGELFVRGPDWIFKPPGWFVNSDGLRQRLRYDQKNLLPTNRAARMAASADGRRIVFGWLGFAKSASNLATQANAVSVWQVNPNQHLWSALSTAQTPPPLPDPVRDFPESSRDFRFGADALVPGHATAAVALNRDGSRTAILEYGVWGWVRTEPAIGKWNPPIHVLNFVPKQPGRLRVFDGTGKELFSEALPEEGMFEIGFDSDNQTIWCWPAAWFARGMAGAVWLPVNAPARSLYHITPRNREAVAFSFPDAISDCAPSPGGGRAFVSCWNGRLYMLEDSDRPASMLNADGPARLAWSADAAFAVAGTADGHLMRVERTGMLTWSKMVPTINPSLGPLPSEVVSGLPIFQGGRFPRSEHAYVGDIWVIKAGREAVMVDSGGVSGFSMTQARLRALGIKQVTHVLHTHSHGDHCGGAYLWRTAGARIVGPKPAAFALTWLMPMLTDYGIYPPRPLDMALPLGRVGDETDFEISDLRFHALFVPGHSFDLTVYTTELAGKRVAFTGDLGFENQDILHRSWGDAEKARAVVGVIRRQLLPWRPDVVFTGHGVRTNGTGFIETLVQQTEESLARSGVPSRRESN